jgi:hypothetical protein
LSVSAFGSFDEVLLLSGQDAAEGVVALELPQPAGVVEWFVVVVFAFGFGFRRERDLEVKLGEQRAREVGVLVAALEDNAVEFVLGDGDGEVGLRLAAGCETREELGVEQRDPGCLRGNAPVEEG